METIFLRHYWKMTMHYLKNFEVYTMAKKFPIGMAVLARDAAEL